jgi:hypothetical protein
MIEIASAAPPRHVRAIMVVIAGVLLAALDCNSVRAEVRVQGQADDVLVEAHDASVADILTALGKRFALHYRGAPEVGGITATFEGPLRRVVARVLAGYNFVIEARGDGIEVIVLSAASPNAVPAPAIAPPTYPSRSNRRD